MIVDHKDKKALDRAMDCLQNDDIFVYPTDTLYGFGCSACSEHALDRLYKIKRRAEYMPLSVIVRDFDMLREYALAGPLAEKMIRTFLPGALTLVLPAKTNDLPDKLFSAGTYLGFRIPDHPFCEKMSALFAKPIITTSVNRSGEPPLNKMEDIHRVFADETGLFISDKDLEIKNNIQASTVLMVDREDHVHILREGLIGKSEINSLLQ